MPTTTAKICLRRNGSLRRKTVHTPSTADGLVLGPPTSQSLATPTGPFRIATSRVCAKNHGRPRPAREGAGLEPPATCRRPRDSAHTGELVELRMAPGRRGDIGYVIRPSQGLRVPEASSHEPEPKCPECSRPIFERDDVAFSHGELLHKGCWLRLQFQPLLAESRRLIQESRELVNRSPAFDNTFDGNGWPICPACTKSIRPPGAVMRQGRSMVHLDCWKPIPPHTP